MNTGTIVRGALGGFLGGFLGLLALTASARAHFIWVVLEPQEEGDTRAHVYFGEGAHADAARLLELKRVESDGDGSLASAVPAGTSVVEAECVYGVFSRGGSTMLLHYYAKAIAAGASDDALRSGKLALDVVPRVVNGALRLRVLWNSQPAEGCQVIVSRPGEDPAELETDAGGAAMLEATAPGRYEIRARLTESESGTFEGEEYDEKRHYATVTLEVPGKIDGERPASDSVSDVARVTGDDPLASLPELPRGITSFGAAVIGDALYVYGGHFGRAHHYSNTSQSGALSRLRLTGSGVWEVIAEGPRLQGLAMVAHGGKLYRVGGFTAHNDEGDDHDLRSVAEFVAFDPDAKKWEPLPSLPEPRSSHDAVVVGDALYVAGGWELGGEEPRWHDTGWVVDLSQAQKTWEAIPQPPFRRRAISLGQLGGKLLVIGGMQETGGPTTRIDVFDPESGAWSEGPSLVGEGMDGFGSSAYAVDGRLFVSTYAGNLQRLDDVKGKWSVVSELEDDRFFHRMLPFEGRLFLVGGASMTSGKRLHFESVELSSLP